MSSLIPFEFESHSIRAIEINNQTWVLVADIAQAIGHSNPRALVKVIDQDDVRKVYVTDSVGRKQKTWAANEAGVYQALLSSNLPKAKPFRKWVTSEVLPSIRRTGQYKADWYKSRHASASSFKLVCDILKLKRAEQGKETKFYHFANEARLINSALTGQFTALDRETLSMDELNVLAMLEERNALMIAAEVKYEVRKQSLEEFMYRLNFVQRDGLAEALEVRPC